MKFRLISLLLVVTFGYPLNAFAAFSCNVDLLNVLFYKSGFINVRHSGRSDYTYICNLNEEWKGVSITTCAMWGSVLVNLHESGKQAQFYYSAEELDDCSELPTYSSAPAPVYVGTTN